MNELEYDFLHGRNKSSEAFSSCLSFGYCVGVDVSGRPILTGRGIKALRAYRDERKVDVV